MSSTTAETLNGTSGTTVAEKRPSKLRSYLESIGKSKIKPTDVELNATLSEDHGIPTLQKFVGYKNPLTIKELINYQEKYEKDDIEITHIQRKDSEDSHHTYSEGFGWVTGVLIRTILCIFGATLFLRMSWIAGQSGLLVGLCIVALGLVIVGITAISMSAIATNGEIRDGGFYYLISRTLGPEFGGSIGIIFYLATIGNAAMNLVGLSEAIVSILKDYNIQLIDGDINDNRVYSLVICLILQAIIFAGTKFEAKAPVQIVLILTIMVSLVSHFIGTFFPTDYQRVRGIIGYSPHILYHNLWPDFRLNESFITVFGIYFPAMAGIMGGVNMAGDLKNPSKAIPKGTLPAIIITTFTYAMIMILTCATTVPDATGFDIPEVDTIHHRFIHPPCRWNNSCPFGQNNDYELMILQGAWPPLIILGIVTTTISAASGCMIGAPRVFQALSADNLFPFLKFFAKSHGEHRLPYRAYVLTFIITCAIILIGRFNTIAELITNFFLAAFAIMNFACFDASAARSPGFRPGISLYNKNLSLGGAILCIIMMFVFSWKLSLMAFGIFAEVNWGSSHQANRYRKVLSNVLKLTHSEQHVKNYRPQILVLTGNPAARQVLVDFADCITKGTNLLICGHVVPYPSLVGATVIAEKLKERYTQWLHDHKIKAFYCAVSQTSLRAGVQILLQNAGVGKMQPNILLIGYKDTWLSQFEEGKMAELHDYWGVINDAFASNLSICIFRNGNEGLDTSGYITDETDKFFLKLPQMSITKFSPLADDLSRGIKKKQHRPKASNMKLDTIRPRPIRQSTMDALSNVMHRTPSGNLAHVPSEGSFGGHPSNQHQKVNVKFRNRIKDGVVDVWWLYDDGGLTWLLAYLLTTHPSFVEDAKLRVFTTCPSNASPEKVQEDVEHMLKKFRITFKEVTVIVYEERELYPETQDEYNDIIEVINADSENPGISEEILKENEMRTRRFMLQREYLLEHSSASDLVIMTLPVASTSIVMSPLYNLWLEMLSRDMPPMLFIRGNHTSVMTLDS